MQISSNVNKRPESNLSRALELCSGERDGELSADERFELQQLRQQFPAECAKFQSQLELLTDWVAELPVIPCSISVVRGIESRIDVVGSTPASAGHRKMGQRVSIMISVVALGLMAVAVTLPVGSRVPAPPEATARLDLPSNISGLGAVHGDWRVVVLSARPSSHSGIVDGLVQAAASRGVSMRQMPGGLRQGGDESVEFLIAEIGASDPLVLMNDMVADGSPETGDIEIKEWDPAEVGAMGRGELLEMIQRSLETPTLSEQHFGSVEMELPASGASSDLANVPEAGTLRSGSPTETGDGHYVLVVLEFANKANSMGKSELCL